MYARDKNKQGILPMQEFLDICEEGGARLAPAEVSKLETLFKDRHSGAVNYKDALRVVEFCTERECWIVRDPNAKNTAPDAFYKTMG